MIYNLPRKQQKQQVTITSNNGFYLNNVFQKQGTYTAQVGDTIKVSISCDLEMMKRIFAKIVFNNQIVKTGSAMRSIQLDYPFTIGNTYKNIQIVSKLVSEDINGQQMPCVQCIITTT